jgi:hypothetical protein
VKRLRDEPGVFDPEGLCATMHHQATGKWPGEGHIVTAGAGYQTWREELHTRDGDGQFADKIGSGGKIPAVPGDKLGLAKRIQLGAGEELRGSRAFDVNGVSDAVPVGAAISTPDGPEMRLGIVGSGDENKWSATNLGGTLKLRADDVERITASLEAENVAAKARSVELRKKFAELDRLDDARDEGRLDDAGEKRRAELEAWNRDLVADDMFAEGRIPGGEWGDLAYQVWGRDGEDADWGFKLAVRPSSDAGWAFPDNAGVAEMDSSDMRRFLKQLNDLAAKASSAPEVAGVGGYRSWREELHARDSDGKFSEKVGGLQIGDALSTVGKFPKIKDLILLQEAGDDTPVGGEVRRDVEKAVEGTYAGFAVKVDKVSVRPNSTQFTAAIFDAGGNPVGKLKRTFHQGDDGDLLVKHDLLQMDSEVQGQGFAEAFNGHLEDWYRESGVSRIELKANIDVGAYAWARQGYDFAAPSDAGRIRRDVMRAIKGAEMDQEEHEPGSPQYRELQQSIDEANRIVEAFDTQDFGSTLFPTPFDVSQLGRKPGQGRNDMWLGKEALLETWWDGVKWLR